MTKVTKITKTKVRLNDSPQYNKLVEQIHSQLKSLAKANLNFYWDFGSAAKAIVDAPATYGGRTVENFCVDVNSRCGSAFSPGTVYKTIAFVRYINKEQLEKMSEAGMAWRNVIPLLRSDLTEEDRNKIIDSVAGQNLAQDKVAEKIATMKGSSPKRKEEPETKCKALGQLKQACARLEEGVDTLTSVRALVEEVLETPNEEYHQEAKALINGLTTTMRELQEVWEADKPEIDESLVDVVDENEEKEQLTPPEE